jgi:hypothetical protein
MSTSVVLLVNDLSIGHSPIATTSRSSSPVRRSRICSSGGRLRDSQMSRKRLAASASLSDCALSLKRPGCFAQSNFRYQLI